MPTALGTVASHRTVIASQMPLSIPWHSAFWAEDPAWTPPADGGTVALWRNAGTSAVNLASVFGAAYEPIYRASHANFNGKPALDFTDEVMSAATPALSQPVHVFIVSYRPSTTGVMTIMDGNAVSMRLVDRGVGADLWVYAGDYATAAAAGVNGTVTHCILYNGASSALRVNGTVKTLTGTCGPNAFGAGLTMGQNAGYADKFYGAIAFVGVKSGALTAQQITDLEAWAKTYYGVPIP